MNVFELFAKLNLDSKGYERSLTTAEKRLNAFGRNAQRIGTSLTAAVTAPIAGLSALAVRAFGEQERAELQLRAALEANGREVDVLFDRYTSLASALQDVTVIGDETTIRMFSQAEALGLTGEAAERAVRNAIGLSSALDLNARSALRYTAVLEEGDTTMLQRYLPALRSIEDESEKVAVAQEMLANMFGSATAEAEAASGQITQMRNAVGDLLEVVGGIVSEALLPFVNRLQDLAERAQELDEDLLRLIVQVGGIAAAIGPLIVAVGLLATGLSAVIGLLSAPAFVTFLVGGAVAIAAIAGAMALFGVDIDDVKKALGNLLNNWPVFVRGLRDSWSAFVDYFQAESDRMFASFDLFTSSIRVGMAGAAIDAALSVEKLINNVIRLFNGFIRRTNEVFGTSLSLAEEFDVTQTAIFQRLERTYNHSADVYMGAVDRQVEATGRAEDAVERLEDGLGTMGSAFTDAGNSVDDATDKVGDFGEEAGNTANSVDDLTEALEKLPDDLKLDPATFLNVVDSSDTINGLKARIATLQRMLGEATTQEVRNAIQRLINEYEATLEELQPTVVPLTIEPVLGTGDPVPVVPLTIEPVLDTGDLVPVADLLTEDDPDGDLLSASEALRTFNERRRDAIILANERYGTEEQLQELYEQSLRIQEALGIGVAQAEQNAIDRLKERRDLLRDITTLQEGFMGPGERSGDLGGPDPFAEQRARERLAGRRGPDELDSVRDLGATREADLTQRRQAQVEAQRQAAEDMQRQVGIMQRAMQQALTIGSTFAQQFSVFTTQIAQVTANMVADVAAGMTSMSEVIENNLESIAQALATGVVSFFTGLGEMVSAVQAGESGIGESLARMVLQLVQQLSAMIVAIMVTAKVMSLQFWNPVLAFAGAAGLVAAAFGLDQLRRQGAAQSAPPSGSIAAREEELARLREQRDLATSQEERDRLNEEIAALERDIREMRDGTMDEGGEEPAASTDSDVSDSDMGASFGGTSQGVQLAVAVPLMDAATIMQSAARSIQQAFQTDGGMTFGAATMSFDSSVERFGSYVDRLVDTGISVNVQGVSRTAAFR